jgi:hypothetical protein
MFRLTVVSFLSTIVCLATGCEPAGPKKYPVSGTVTFNGNPLPEGHIVMTPADGKSAPDAATITDGKYFFVGTAGPKKVEISATREDGPIDPVMGQAPRKQYLAPRFNAETTLEANVTASGPNTFDFQVSEK